MHIAFQDPMGHQSFSLYLLARVTVPSHDFGIFKDRMFSTVLTQVFCRILEVR
jgi:hypothetical protein